MEDSQIEKDFEILGITGFEDKLQDGVFECLSEFSNAGIKTWIVTGDKGETARSIGYQCGVLSDSRKLQRIEEFESHTVDGLKKAFNPLTESARKEGADVLIAGQAITDMMNILSPESKEIRKEMLELILQAKGFVVYRSSPK